MPQERRKGYDELLERFGKKDLDCSTHKSKTAEIEKDVKGHSNALYGNGKEGLLERMTKQEVKMSGVLVGVVIGSTAIVSAGVAEAFVLFGKLAQVTAIIQQHGK